MKKKSFEESRGGNKFRLKSTKQGNTIIITIAITITITTIIIITINNQQ